MDNLRGILLMVGAMAAFAIEDGFIKVATHGMPVGEVLLVLGLGGFAVFGAAARATGRKVFSPDILHRSVLLRNLGEIVGTLGFVTALATIPLSTATTILQAMPLVVTFGAALFLRETVGWRRWTAIAVGFAGVVLVIKPGFAGFDVHVLWALLCVAGLSVRDLATRRIPRTISTTQLSAWAYGAITLLGLALLATVQTATPLDTRSALLLAAAIATGVVGYWALTESMRLGELSAIAPFRYARLVFGMSIGMFAFSERPDRLSLAGAALILLAGLYALFRERHRASRKSRA